MSDASIVTLFVARIVDGLSGGTAACLVLTLVLSIGHTVTDSETSFIW